MFTRATRLFKVARQLSILPRRAHAYRGIGALELVRPILFDKDLRRMGRNAVVGRVYLCPVVEWTSKRSHPSR